MLFASFNYIVLFENKEEQSSSSTCRLVIYKINCYIKQITFTVSTFNGYERLRYAYTHSTLQLL